MEMPSRPPNPAMPYREDCWSEGETSVLVDVWGDRFLDLNRGNLRQKQWQEVADAVNARRPEAGRRPPRTDIQCKNRIDTLKKKYKIEKGKISDGAFGSQWPFYSRLDMLIGSSVPVKKPPLSSSSPPLALPLPSYRKGLALPAAATVRAVESLPKEKRTAAVGLSVGDSFFGRNYTVAAAAAAAAAVEVESRSSSKFSGSSTDRSRSTRDRSARGSEKRRKGRDGGGISELTRVIEWFADVYEKVEVEKQRQMIELEKERIEFIKGLEFQRMQMFLDTQVQVEKIKRARRSDADVSDIYS